MLLRRMARVMLEGQGSKGADSALRAASVAMQDKASNVRAAGTALLTGMLGLLGQGELVAAAGLLPSGDTGAAMEALSKVLGGPVSIPSAALQQQQRGPHAPPPRQRPGRGLGLAAYQARLGQRLALLGRGGQ
jgi:hypothetical protein